MDAACSQPLYEDGALVAYCSQPYGSEHDHSDKTASEAILIGLAVEAPACDFCGESKVTHVGDFTGACDDHAHLEALIREEDIT